MRERMLRIFVGANDTDELREMVPAAKEKGFILCDPWDAIEMIRDQRPLRVEVMGAWAHACVSMVVRYGLMGGAIVKVDLAEIRSSRVDFEPQPNTVEVLNVRKQDLLSDLRTWAQHPKLKIIS